MEKKVRKVSNKCPKVQQLLLASESLWRWTKDGSKTFFYKTSDFFLRFFLVLSMWCAFHYTMRNLYSDMSECDMSEFFFAKSESYVFPWPVFCNIQGFFFFFFISRADGSDHMKKCAYTKISNPLNHDLYRRLRSQKLETKKQIYRPYLGLCETGINRDRVRFYTLTCCIVYKRHAGALSPSGATQIRLCMKAFVHSGWLSRSVRPSLPSAVHWSPRTHLALRSKGRRVDDPVNIMDGLTGRSYLW